MWLMVCLAVNASLPYSTLDIIFNLLIFFSDFFLKTHGLSASVACWFLLGKISFRSSMKVVFGTLSYCLHK
ncbi:hypothetical protein BDN70DRAFT_683500 [Pholiota conissans]|uniref:Uncharacterized protein n=1 Tax=Pholiota conissans TaxID=109636 RepID=A0A9P5Z1C5_9AGAR|nr:hypothetical protein BDN70DRAFT_683500 [Pholiota conissans]